VGWIKEVAPNLVDYRIEFNRDTPRGGKANDGITNDTLEPRLVTLATDPLHPTWLIRNGLPLETQMMQLSTDVPEEISDVQMGDRFVRIADEKAFVAKARATVSPATDYPAAEIMVEDQQQGGRR
jgi:hypothetical protein